MIRRIPTAILMLVLLAGGCGDDASPDTPDATSAATTAAAPAATGSDQTTEAAAFTAAPGGPGDEWPEEFVANMMTACMEDASEDACRCTVQEFQSRYTFDDFFSWAGEAAEDDPRITEVRAICGF
jgi:hypothetical protein